MVLLIVLLTSAVFETLGLGMVLPLLQTAIQPEEQPFYGLQLLKHVPTAYRLLTVCVFTIILFVFKSAFSLLRHYYSASFINRLRQYWSAGIMENYLMSKYTDMIKHRQGVLINNMVHEPTYASKALRDLVDLTANLLIAIGISSLLLAVNWRMTLAIGAFSGLALVLMWRLTREYSMDVGRRKITLNQQITQIAAESIAGVRQLKIFSLESRVGKEFADHLSRLVKIIVGFSVVRTLPLVIGELLIVVITVGIFLLYKYGFNADLVSIIPVLGLFMVCAVRFFTNISRFLSQRMSIASYWPSLRLVSDLCEKTDSAKIEDKGKVIRKLSKGITFDHVDFIFESNVQLFNRLYLEIPKGRITAVVGLSGAGKSTLCDLITHFYVPTDGKIWVDGIDLNELSVQSWRQRIGYVSQDTFLFNTTIAENIAIGLPEGADDKRVFLAAEKAGVNEFIKMLPEGYQTPVGHGGVSLSGGQRQRIAIARALTRDPDLIIFDEATSSLDSKIERQLLESIKNISANKAVLFITHRLSSLWIADYIYFLENGRIVESGTYHSLVETKGAFWKLLQLSENENPQKKRTSL